MSLSKGFPFTFNGTNQTNQCLKAHDNELSKLYTDINYSMAANGHSHTGNGSDGAPISYNNLLNKPESLPANGGHAATATELNGVARPIGYSQGGAITSGGAGGPQVMGGANQAAMLTFHRPGEYAVHFGLDTDNQLACGGATAGTTRRLIAFQDQIPAAATPGLTNYVADGLKLTPSAGLTATVSAGRASISETVASLAAPIDITLDARRACLVYLTKSGSVGKVNAILPAVDTNTVAMWDFSNWDGTSAIPNSAVGVNGNTIAVVNNLTKSGTVTRVDGHVGYGAQGDGSTGYFASANSTGFPTSAQEYEIDVLFNINKLTAAQQQLLQMGGIWLYTYDITGNIYFAGTSGANINSGFSLEVGKKALVSLCFDGANTVLKINGTTVYTYAGYYSLANTLLYIMQTSAAISRGNYTIDYVELRNKMRTPAQIAQISNDLLIPCQYNYDMVNQSDGTAIGNMTNNGGLSAGFTGTIDGYASAPGLIGTNSLIGYIGKNWGSGRTKKLDKIILCTSTDYAFTTSVNKNVTIELQGSTDNFAGSIVSLGILPSATYTTNSYITMSLIDKSTAYQYHRVKITETGGDGGSHTLTIDEVQFYEAQTTSDIRSILPADSISLGYAKTSSTAVTEIDTDSYKYGRRDGAVGGNRRVFLGWKYFSGTTTLTWNNPFGTRKVKTYYMWAQDASGTNESDVVLDYLYITSRQTPSQRISCTTGTTGATIFNGAVQNSGYIGCYAEVID